jgi:hypothetical protein
VFDGVGVFVAKSGGKDPSSTKEIIPLNDGAIV